MTLQDSSNDLYLGHREYHLANTFLFLFLVLPYYYLIVTQVSRLGNLELMKLMRMPLIYILSSSWVRGFVSRRNYRSDHLWNHGNSITEGAPAMPRCVASIEKKGGAALACAFGSGAQPARQKVETPIQRQPKARKE